MPRYVALLRGVSPMNAKMSEVKRAFESAGFTNVKTLLSSGNVAFDTRAAAEATIIRKAEDAMQDVLGRNFPVVLRKQGDLQALIESDAFAGIELSAKHKKVVTFLQAEPQAALDLPIEKDGATILAMKDREIYTAYVPSSKGAAFMVLIEKTFGKAVTTRTWDTVRKCAVA